MLATQGCVPSKRKEEKTQSPGWEYGVFWFHRNTNSDNKGCKGTGPFEALLFGKPTLPHVHVRRIRINASAKLTSCHCKPKHSEMRRPVPAANSVRVRSGFCR